MADVTPTLAGFQNFVTTVMGVPATFNPVTSSYTQYAYDVASAIVNPQLAGAHSPLYAVAVYSLAADTLINTAQDSLSDPIYKDGLAYWAWLRKQYGVLNFVPGVLTSTSDEGTSSSYQALEVFTNMTILNLQNLKTPYGRMYLGLAQSWGTPWGMS